METKPASELEEGNSIVLDAHPCKVIKLEPLPGKMGPKNSRGLPNIRVTAQNLRSGEIIQTVLAPNREVQSLGGFKVLVSELRPTDEIVYEGRAVRIERCRSTVMGRHSRRIDIQGVDLFRPGPNRGVRFLLSPTDHVELAAVARHERTVAFLEDLGMGTPSMSLMDQEGQISEAPLPEGELGAQILDAIARDKEVTVGVLIWGEDRIVNRVKVNKWVELDEQEGFQEVLTKSAAFSC